MLHHGCVAGLAFHRDDGLGRDAGFAGALHGLQLVVFELRTPVLGERCLLLGERGSLHGGGCGVGVVEIFRHAGDDRGGPVLGHEGRGETGAHGIGETGFEVGAGALDAGEVVFLRLFRHTEALMEGGNIFGLGGGVRHLQQAVGGDAEMFFEFAGLPGGGDGDLLGVVDFPAFVLPVAEDLGLCAVVPRLGSSGGRCGSSTCGSCVAGLVEMKTWPSGVVVQNVRGPHGLIAPGLRAGYISRPAARGSGRDSL